MMQRSCEGCGKTYEARRVTAKYCGSTCRTRASRSGLSARPVKAVAAAPTPAEPATEAPTPEPAVIVADGGELTKATIRSLEDAQRLHTPLGLAAVVLAQRLDNSYRDTGSAVASLVRQLQATLTAATAGAGKETSPVQMARDDLAARRERAQRSA